MLRAPAGRRGITVVEVLALAFVIIVVAFVLLMAVPRAREQARLTGCRRNLGQIGFGLALYDQMHQHLPTVAELAALDTPRLQRAPAPLQVLIESLQLPDLTELNDPRNAPRPRPGEVPGEMPVPGFVCASDPNALAGNFRAPVSYRGATGDSALGENGIFAPGRTIGLKEVEAGDGASYTAAFSERLVGDNRNGHVTLADYAALAGAVSDQGCPADTGREAWRGDSGSSWKWCDYRSTLYNHGLRPNGRPSCLALDGQTAQMGASSGHTRGVHLLLLDGTVTLVRPEINQKIWREFARLNPPSPE
jgi:hypothetical protein